MNNFFDNDMTVILLLLVTIGLADINGVVALMVGLIALLAGVMKCITLWKQFQNNKLARELKQKQLDDLNS